MGSAINAIEAWQTNGTLKDKLIYALHNEEHTDVNFLVGADKEVVRCHKIFLVLNSPVFSTMFSGRWKSTDDIHVPDAEPNAFRNFLQFLYTEEVRFPLVDVLQLNYLAKKYNVSSLVEYCKKSLKTGIDFHIAFEVYKYADGFGDSDMKQIAVEWMCRNAKIVLSSIQFNSLNLKQLSSIIERDDLKIDELSVFKAVFCWSKSECQRQNLQPNSENCRKVLKDALYLIRFPVMSPNQFLLDVCDEGLLTAEEKMNVIKYISLSPSIRASRKITTCFPTTGRILMQIHTICRKQGPVNESYNYACIPLQHCFQVNTSIWIVSFGLFGSGDSPGPYAVELWLMNNQTSEVVAKTYVDKTFEISGGVFHVELEKPVYIPKDHLFTVCTKVNKGLESCFRSNQVLKPIVDFTSSDGETVTFHFLKAASNNTLYQFPEVSFRLAQ